LKEQKGLSNKDVSVITQRSEGTISDLMNSGKSFSDKLIFSVKAKIADYIGHDANELVTSLTQYRLIDNIASACKRKSDMRLVVGNTGIGKSVVCKEFSSRNENSYYFKADRKYTRNKLFLELNRVMMCPITNKSSNALLDNIIRKVEETTEGNPILFIDEAEVLPNARFKDLKDLFTATEGLLGIMIVGITDTARKLAKLSGLTVDFKGSIINFYPLKTDSNDYTTMVRRINGFRISNISPEDIVEYCRSKGIKNEDVLKEASKKWWNYGLAETKINRALRIGFNLPEMTLEQFNRL
jgi:type II secretory pathway predicted ATPase ExeA